MSAEESQQAPSNDRGDTIVITEVKNAETTNVQLAKDETLRKYGITQEDEESIIALASVLDLDAIGDICKAYNAPSGMDKLGFVARVKGRAVALSKNSESNGNEMKKLFKDFSETIGERFDKTMRQYRVENKKIAMYDRSSNSEKARRAADDGAVSFKQQVIDYYGQTLCMITGKDSATAAHLIPNSAKSSDYGDLAVGYRCEFDQHCPRNGILLCRELEYAMDRHDIYFLMNPLNSRIQLFSRVEKYEDYDGMYLIYLNDKAAPYRRALKDKYETMKMVYGKDFDAQRHNQTPFSTIAELSDKQSEADETDIDSKENDQAVVTSDTLARNTNLKKRKKRNKHNKGKNENYEAFWICSDGHENNYYRFNCECCGEHRTLKKCNLKQIRQKWAEKASDYYGDNIGEYIGLLAPNLKRLIGDGGKNEAPSLGDETMKSQSGNKNQSQSGNKNKPQSLASSNQSSQGNKKSKFRPKLNQSSQGGNKNEIPSLGDKTMKSKGGNKTEAPSVASSNQSSQGGKKYRKKLDQSSQGGNKNEAPSLGDKTMKSKGSKSNDRLKSNQSSQGGGGSQGGGSRGGKKSQGGGSRGGKKSQGGAGGGAGGRGGNKPNHPQ